MKKFSILVSLIIPILFGCEKNESPPLSLDIYSSSWYTKTCTRDSITFIEIHLKVSGYSNAALLSIENGGDGIAGCSEIKCAEGKFSTDACIFFFPSYAQLHRRFSTVLTAYSSREQPKIVFCDATGSGDTIIRRLDSPVLPQ